MLIPVTDIDDEKWLNEVDELEQKSRAWNDLLKNATTGMMSWAERNYKQKLIDILYKMDYYKYNQTIYLKKKTPSKEN